jgi:hypothetical protein
VVTGGVGVGESVWVGGCYDEAGMDILIHILANSIERLQSEALAIDQFVFFGGGGGGPTDRGWPLHTPSYPMR